MAVITTREIFTIAVLGGLSCAGGLITAAALGIALYTLHQRAVPAVRALRARRRALKAGRHQLSTFTTIDDLKD
ncbi:hypothetical protein [Streptomyces sp. NPDC055058]